MIHPRLQELFDKYLGEAISPQELTELQHWIKNEQNTEAFDALLQKAYASSDYAVSADYNINEVFTELMAKTKMATVVPMTSKPRRQWWAVAACLILLAGVGGYYLFFQKPVRRPFAINSPVAAADVKAPETAKALLTLADGRKLYLDSAGNGTLARQGSVAITKNANGEIVYSTTGPSAAVAFNTLYNPRGSKVFSLTLTDGTKVWLNSESAIKYPTAFTGTTREVEITGEAYFEVAHDPGKKFIVKGNGVSTEVLGTHFNVNTYSDEEAIKVTLLEGSVRVKPGEGSGEPGVVLKPGEQAVLRQAQADKPDRLVINKNPDMEQTVAWKNGQFSFKGADLPTVMRQLSRWYDIEVTYEGVIPLRRFEGKIQKDLSLSDVLEALADNQVHYTINGKKIVLKP